MSGTGPQFAVSPAPALPKGRTPLAHLLHALNQPLTGLQCSLELAVAGPRPTDQYIRTLREGLDLVSRMRLLVEAIREVAVTQPSSREEPVFFRLETLLFDAAAELQAVAAARNVRIRVTADSALQVWADRARIATLFFRLLDSALNLSSEHTVLQVTAIAEHDRACLSFSWSRGAAPEYSPFSRPDLGLLVAQTTWEQAGGSWDEIHTDAARTCVLRLCLATNRKQSNSFPSGDAK